MRVLRHVGVRSVPVFVLAFGVGLLMLSALSTGNARAQATPVASPASASAGQAEIGEDLGRQSLSASPNDVDARLLESDERARGLGSLAPETGLHKAWEGFVNGLRRDQGIDLGLNYTALYQNASESKGKHAAAGGDLDFFGSWKLWDRDGSWPGRLVFFSEWRHKFMDVAPSQLGREIGSLWGTTSAFSEQDVSVVQLYWDQGSFKDGFRYRLGKIDPGTLYDAGRYVSANHAFLSPAFYDTLAMPLPGAGLGAVAAVYPYGQTYIMAGVHDANGEKTTTGVHSLRRGELFTAVEIGATPGFGKIGEGLYHLTLWHSDARDKARVPSGRGLAVTAEQELGPRGEIVPWLRYSYADGGGTRVRQALAAGIGFEDPFGKPDDLAGIGLAWGQPRDTKLRDQYVAEAFYRFHLTPYTHLTPDIQWIFNPSEAPNQDSILVLGLRLRTLF